jgi:geranylgeranylglycerol-phosphate geranylgeranyltransferase
VPAYLRLVRGGNVAVSFLGTFVGGLVAVGRGLPLQPLLLASLALAGLSTACVTAGGNVLNDIGDRESDRQNHPDRPLVTGEVSLGAARWLVVALLVASALLIAPILPAHPLLAPILAAAVLAVVAYEGHFKAEGLSGNALVAFLTAAVFLYGGAAGGNVLLLLPFALMAFGATLSREIIKDMEDATGDVGRRTLPRVHGLGVSSLAARVAVTAAIVLSPTPFLWFLDPRSVAGLIYLALVLLADALFVVSVARLPQRLHEEQGLSKAAMTVAIVAFLAAAFR